ncbi:MAG: aspartate ammonia-lyase, partial [Negativicutes bacterium]|nr:aspartate ammonia-lyase [Negativicutes bacterium]
EPVMGWSLFKSINHLANGCMTLREHCVQGITANRELLAERVRRSVSLVTALNPRIGYERSALLAKTALAQGRSIAEVAEDLGIMRADEVEQLLRPELLTQPMPAVRSLT